MTSADKLFMLVSFASGEKNASPLRSKKSQLHKSPRVADLQAYLQYAERFLNTRVHSMTPSIFGPKPTGSERYCVKMSSAFVSAQRRWALNFLIGTWHDRGKSLRHHLQVCDNLRLSLSWYSGMDLFSWESKRVIEYFVQLCTEGKLKVYILPL